MGNLCDAPFLYDRERGALMAQNSLTYLWHFSHFIQSGAVRIGFSRYTTDLDVTALKNPDGTLVSVVMNRTRQTKKACIRVQGQMANVALPPRSISTMVIQRG